VLSGPALATGAQQTAAIASIALAGTSRKESFFDRSLVNILFLERGQQPDERSVPTQYD
jgi:hypothetical protein